MTNEEKVLAAKGLRDIAAEIKERGWWNGHGPTPIEKPSPCCVLTSEARKTIGLGTLYSALNTTNVSGWNDAHHNGKSLIRDLLANADRLEAEASA